MTTERDTHRNEPEREDDLSDRSNNGMGELRIKNEKRTNLNLNFAKS
jgi:hypothetical protein